MNNITKLYWLTRLDELKDMCVTISILCVVMVLLYIILSAIVMGTDSEKGFKKYKWLRNLAIIFLPLFSITGLFIPTKNEMIFIFAGGKTMDFIQKDTSINKIPGQTTAIISNFLEKQIKELKTEKP